MKVEITEIEIEPAKPAVTKEQITLYLEREEAELFAAYLGLTVPGTGVPTYAMFDALEEAGLFIRNKYVISTNGKPVASLHAKRQ